MSAINSSSLFHLTKRYVDLKSIIKKGLRFSYCFESLPKDIVFNNLFPATMNLKNDIKTSDNFEKYGDVGVAIPMVCFCDIPLLRINEHKSKYGNYAIGFDKDFLKEQYNHIINPVWYMNSDNVLDSIIHFSKMSKDADKSRIELIIECNKNQTLRDQIKKNGIEEIFKDDKLNEQFQSQFLTNFFVNNLLALSKPYEHISSNNENICNYDEREWRAIIHNGIDNNTNWHWVTKVEFDYNKKNWNNEIETCKNGFIKIQKGLQFAITHIIVNNDNEIRTIVKQIMKSEMLFGEKCISDNEKLMLISKITSFERIEKDF